MRWQIYFRRSPKWTIRSDDQSTRARWYPAVPGPQLCRGTSCSYHGASFSPSADGSIVDWGNRTEREGDETVREDCLTGPRAPESGRSARFPPDDEYDPRPTVPCFAIRAGERSIRLLYARLSGSQGQRSPKLNVIASKGRMLTGSSSFALAISSHCPSWSSNASRVRSAGSMSHRCATPS